MPPINGQTALGVIISTLLQMDPQMPGVASRAARIEAALRDAGYLARG